MFLAFYETMLLPNKDTCFFNIPLMYYQDLYVAIANNFEDINYYDFCHGYKDKPSKRIIAYAYIERNRVSILETNLCFRKRNIATNLLNFVEKDINKRKKIPNILVPDFPIECASEFWIKFFERRYNIHNKFELKKFVKEHKIFDKYKALYDAYDAKIIRIVKVKF
jgi:hypothetical protein